MPLERGCSKRVRSRNIGRLVHEGREPSQASAIAYSEQRRQGCSVPRKAYKGRARGNAELDYIDVKVLEKAARNKHGLVWIVVEARGYQDLGAHIPLRAAEKLVREGLLARDDQTPITSSERGEEKNFIVVTYTVTACGTLAYKFIQSSKQTPKPALKARS